MITFYCVVLKIFTDAPLYDLLSELHVSKFIYLFIIHLP